MLLLGAIVYTIALVIVTFINLGDVPDLGSSFDDKIYHVIAYAVLSYLWCSYFRPIKSNKIDLKVVIALLAFGAFLEAIQQQINPNRTTDLVDLLSNCVGVFIGTVLAKRYNIFKLNIF